MPQSSDHRNEQRSRKRAPADVRGDPAQRRAYRYADNAVGFDDPVEISRRCFSDAVFFYIRILVCFEGQIMGEYSGKNPPIEEISLAMTGK